jgi:hypothetical protein
MDMVRLAAGGGLALALLLTSGCSDDEEPAAAPSSSEPAAPAPASPTSGNAMSPSSAPDRTTAGTSSDLVNGRHAARITRVDAAGGRVTVDVVQFFLGEDATRAAREDGAEEVPPPNDVWIRNTSRALRTLPVARGAPITVNALGAPESGSATKNIAKTLAQLAEIDGIEDGIFWLTVADGQVTRIAEQYLP